MTQPNSPAVGGKQEHDRLKRNMERGAKTTLETKRRLAAPGAQLGPERPVVVELPQAGELIKEMGGPDVAVHLVLQLQHDTTPDYAVLAFLNNPKADANTPTTAPGYAGSFAFFGPSDDTPAHHEVSVRLPVTAVIDRLGRPDRFTLTLVPVGYPGRPRRQQTATLTASLEAVLSKVEPN